MEMQFVLVILGAVLLLLSILLYKKTRLRRDVGFLCYVIRIKFYTFHRVWFRATTADIFEV